MSFGLGHGRTIDTALGTVGISPEELGSLPDSLLQNPESARVDPRQWFGDPSRPFELEIGSGKGTFLIQQAALEPGTNFLGIEWAKEFYAYAADRIRRQREAGALLNVRMLHADAAEFLRWRCPANIIGVIHLYFSDPWPKSKHHKKRVIQHAFLAEAWRCLAPDGELRIVTDHDELWAWDCAHFDQWTEANTNPRCPDIPESVAKLRVQMPAAPFELVSFDRPESAGTGELVGTNFERKFRQEGRSFHSCVLRKLG